MDFRTITSITVEGQSISKITDSLGNVIWKKGGTPPPHPINDYLWIENTYDGQNVVTVTKEGTPQATHFYWSKNGTTWNEQQISALPMTITLEEGEYVYFKNDQPYWSMQYPYDIIIRASQWFNVGGNIASLVNYSETMTDGCFKRLFQGNTKLLNAKDLILPFDEVKSNSYSEMFDSCTSLETAPILPATIIGFAGYHNMFKGTKITQAPEIKHITTFKSTNNLEGMFYNCTLLDTAPELPNITLTNLCYEYLFRGCNKLKSIKWDYNFAPNSTYCDYWVSGVASSGTFYRTDESWTPSYGTSGVPTGWTVEQYTKHFIIKNTYAGDNVLTISKNGTGTPLATHFDYSTDGKLWNRVLVSSLPLSITIPENGSVYLRGDEGYWSSFYPESQVINYISIKCSKQHKVLGKLVSLLGEETEYLQDCTFYGLFYGDDTLVDASDLDFNMPKVSHIFYNVFHSMFRNCTSLVTAPYELKKIGTNAYGYMFDGCSALTTAPILPSSVANYIYQYMFRNCTSLVNAPALPATTLLEGCYQGMFEGCTSIINAPKLTAETLVSNCYKEMFKNCTSLNSINAKFLTDPSTGNYTVDWVNGVASEGMFVKNSSATWDVVGNNGVPIGWTILIHSYSVEIPTDVTYGFDYDGEYYVSTNKGIDNSFSYCILHFNGYGTLKIETVQNSESGYDYGLLSYLDSYMSKSNSIGDQLYQIPNGTNTYEYTTDGGEHFITIKYRKDGSVSSGDDTMKFRIIN